MRIVAIGRGSLSNSRVALDDGSQGDRNGDGGWAATSVSKMASMSRESDELSTIMPLLDEGMSWFSGNGTD